MAIKQWVHGKKARFCCKHTCIYVRVASFMGTPNKMCVFFWPLFTPKQAGCPQKDTHILALASSCFLLNEMLSLSESGYFLGLGRHFWAPNWRQVEFISHQIWPPLPPKPAEGRLLRLMRAQCHWSKNGGARPPPAGYFCVSPFRVISRPEEFEVFDMNESRSRTGLQKQE